MVVSTDELARQVGVDVLRSGGNAMDAAVAVMFALAVVNPEAGNLGGDGFLVLRTAEGETAALDFRARAPFASTRDMYLGDDGEVTEDVVVGHLSVGVPGTVDGMWEVHQRFGRLDWTTLLDPAIELAGGFPVRPRFLNSLGDAMVAALQAFPASADSSCPAEAGRPPSGTRSASRTWPGLLVASAISAATTSTLVRRRISSSPRSRFRGNAAGAHDLGSIREGAGSDHFAGRRHAVVRGRARTGGCTGRSRDVSERYGPWRGRKHDPLLDRRCRGQRRIGHHDRELPGTEARSP